MAGFLLYQNAAANDVKGDINLSNLFTLQDSFPNTEYQNILYPGIGKPRLAPIPVGDEPFTLLFPATREPDSTHIALTLKEPLSSQRLMRAKNENIQNLFEFKPESEAYNFALLSGYVKDIGNFLSEERTRRNADVLRPEFERLMKYVVSWFTEKNVSRTGVLLRLMLSDNSALEQFIERFKRQTREYRAGTYSYVKNADLLEKLPTVIQAIFTNCYLVFFLEKDDKPAMPCIEYLGDFNYDAHKRGSAPVRVFTCAISDGDLEFGMHKPEDVRDLFRPEAASKAAKFNVNLARELLSSTATFEDKATTFEDKVRIASQNLSA